MLPNGWTAIEECAPADPADRCWYIDLSRVQDVHFDAPQKFTFHLVWRPVLGLTSDTSDDYDFEVAFLRNEDSSLEYLEVGTDLLRTPFTHGGQQRVTADYHIDIPRRFSPVPFFVKFMALDPFATVDVDYFPPIRDNGEIDGNRRPIIRRIRNAKGPVLMSELSPDADGSKEYSWGVPYGESLLRITVTDEKTTGRSVFNLYIHHRRHTENRIASVLSTLGVLSPAFRPDTYLYQLSMRVNDPTKQLRLLFSQMDLFSNISVTLRVPAPVGTELTFAQSLGTKLPVSSAKAQCGYRQSLKFLPPYGESTLILNMTADSGPWVLTTIRIRKVAFQLLALNNSVGVLDPPFHPRHLSYRLLLANAQSQVTLSSTHADNATHLTWRWQPLSARRGSELLWSERRTLPVSEWLHEQVTFSDLPLGLTSVSVQLRAFDGSTTTYTILLERVVLEELSLSLLTLAVPERVPIQTGQDGFNGIAAALTPEYDPGTQNYTLSLPPGQTEVVMRFPVPPSPIQLIGEWRGVPLRPLQKNSTLMLAVFGVTSTPGLLRLTFLKGTSVLQLVNIVIVQQLSANAFLGSIWTNAGRLQPKFSYAQMNYVLRLEVAPVDLWNGTLPLLQTLLRVQDANATLHVALHRALPRNTSAPADTPPTFLPAESVALHSAELGGSLLHLLTVGGADVKVYNHSLLQVFVTAPNGVFQQQYNLSLELHEFIPVPEIPYVWATTVQLVLTLQADLSSLGDLEAARQLLVTEVAGALGMEPTRLRVLRLYAGSTMAEVRMLPAASAYSSEVSSVESLRLLRLQLASFEGSPLSFGRHSSRVDPTVDLQVKYGCMTPEEEFISNAEECQRLARGERVLMQEDAPTPLPSFVVPLVVVLSLLCAAALAVVAVRCYLTRRTTRVSHLQANAVAAAHKQPAMFAVPEEEAPVVRVSMHVTAETASADASEQGAGEASADSSSASKSIPTPADSLPSPSKSDDWVMLNASPLNDDAAPAAAASPLAPVSVDTASSPVDFPGVPGAGGWSLHSPVALPSPDSLPPSAVSPRSASSLTPSPRSAVSSPSSSSSTPKPTVRLRLPPVQVRSPLKGIRSPSSSTAHLSILMLLGCCVLLCGGALPTDARIASVEQVREHSALAAEPLLPASAASPTSAPLPLYRRRLLNHPATDAAEGGHMDRNHGVPGAPAACKYTNGPVVARDPSSLAAASAATTTLALARLADGAGSAPTATTRRPGAFVQRNQAKVEAVEARKQSLCMDALERANDAPLDPLLANPLTTWIAPATAGADAGAVYLDRYEELIEEERQQSKGLQGTCAFRLWDTKKFRAEDRSAALAAFIAADDGEEEEEEDEHDVDLFQYIVLVPLTEDTYYRLREHRSVLYQTAGEARAGEDRRHLRYWNLAEYYDEEYAQPIAVGDPCPVDCVMQIQQVFPMVAPDGGETEAIFSREYDPETNPRHYPPAPPDREDEEEFTKCFTYWDAATRTYRPLAGKAIVTQRDPSGTFLTCTLYKQTAAAADSPFLWTAGGRWDTGFAAGALPYNSLPCDANKQVSCPAAYATGVGTTFRVADDIKKTLQVNRGGFADLKATDLSATPATLGQSYATSGALNWVGRTAKDKTLEETWAKTNKHTFEYGTTYNLVQSSFLNSATLKKFAGKRKKQDGQETGQKEKQKSERETVDTREKQLTF